MFLPAVNTEKWPLRVNIMSDKENIRVLMEMLPCRSTNRILTELVSRL